MTTTCFASCLSNGCFFCDLSQGALREFDAISLSGFYPRGAKLFTEGQAPKGVYILCSGRAKLSVGSSSGKSLMRIAERGEIVGLSATLTSQPYEGSAEMLDAGQVNFIRREHFLNFLQQQADASLRVARHLSSAYLAVHEQARSLALSESAAEKLAMLLLGWINKSGLRTEHGIHVKLSLTQGEMAQMIGVSRETVTRLLGEWRSKGIIQFKGANLIIKDKTALEGIVKL